LLRYGISSSKLRSRRDASRVIPSVLRSNGRVDLDEDLDVVLLQQSKDPEDLGQLSSLIELSIGRHLRLGLQRPVRNWHSNVGESNPRQFLNIGLDDPGGPVVVQFLDHRCVGFQKLGVGILIGHVGIAVEQQIRVKKLLENQPSTKVDSVDLGIGDGSRIRQRQKTKNRK